MSDPVKWHRRTQKLPFSDLEFIEKKEIIDKKVLDRERTVEQYSYSIWDVTYV
jgi:hypothetical protein